MSEEIVQVKISRKLYLEIEKALKSRPGEYPTVDSFIEFAISEVLDVGDSEKMTPEDQETVSRRLRAFGY